MEKMSIFDASAALPDVETGKSYSIGSPDRMCPAQPDSVAPTSTLDNLRLTLLQPQK